MVQLDKDLLTWIKEKFYTKPDVESLLSNKSDTNHTHTADSTLSTTSVNPVANSVITNELETKAPNNHASTTTDYGVATDTKYGHVKVDTALNTTSTSPVQNKKIKEALDGKAASVHSHSSLSSTIISSNQNLNNYKTPGEYYCNDNTVAASLSNCPVTIAFHLSVIQHAGVRQILKAYATNNVRTYERNYYNNSWSTWYLTYTTETLTTSNGLMSTNEKTKLSQIAEQATRNIVDTSLNTGSDNAISNKAVTTGLNTKAPTNHAVTGNTYGLGTTSNHGHVKTINGLTQSSHIDGTALSAYQGKILKDLIDGKASTNHTHTGTELRLGSTGSDANTTIQEAVSSKLDSSHNNSKATTGAYGHTKLSSSTSSTDETLAATPKAVKTTYDFAATKPSLGYNSTQAAPGNHAHGSLTNGGTINSDASAVNKVVVTDQDNNIKTFNKLPAYAVTHQDISGKAPNNHASTNKSTYGGATASNYGHVKLTDRYAFNDGDASSSVAASGKALYNFYSSISKGNDPEGAPVTITNLLNGWTGTIKCFVRNGWCIIYFSGLKKSSTTSSPVNVCELPYGNLTHDNIYAPTNLEDIIVRVDQNYLQARCLNTSHSLYGNITFPVNVV